MTDFKKIIKDGIIGGIVNPSSSGAPGSGAPPSAAQVLDALGETAIPLATTLLYVDSVAGLDTNDGLTIGAPYQTLGKAMGAVRGLRELGRNHKVNIILAGSTDTGYAAEARVYPVVNGDFNNTTNIGIRCNTYMIIDGPFRATTSADLDWDGGCLMTVLADDAGVAKNPGWVPGNTYKNGTSSVGLRGGYFVTGEHASVPGSTPSSLVIDSEQNIQWGQNAWPVVGAVSNNQLRCCLWAGGYARSWTPNNGVPVVDATTQWGITDPSTFAISGLPNPAGGTHPFTGKNYLVRLAARIDFHGATTGRVHYQPSLTRLEFHRVYLGPEYDEPDATKYVYWQPDLGAPVKYQFCAWGPVRLHTQGHNGSSYGGYIRLVHNSTNSQNFRLASAVLDMGHPGFLSWKCKEGGTLEFHDQCAFIDNPSPRGVRVETGSSVQTKSGAEEIPAVSTDTADFDGASIFLDNSYGLSTAAYNTGIERLVFHGQIPAGGVNYIDYIPTLEFEGVSPQDDVRLSDGVTQATPRAGGNPRRSSETQIIPVVSGGTELSNPWRIPSNGRLAGIFVVPLGGTVAVAGGVLAEYTVIARRGVDFGGALLSAGNNNLDTVADGVEEPTDLTSVAGALEMTQGEYVVVQFDNSTGTVTGPTSLIVTVVFDLD
jgi:hypothetical protein